MKKWLIIPLVAIIGLFGLTSCSIGGKDATTVKVVTTAELQTQIESLEAKIITLENKLNTVPQSAEVAAIKADLASVKTQLANLTIPKAYDDAALKASVSAANANVNTLMAEIASLKSSNNTMQASIKALQDEIAALKAPPTTTGTSKVTATIKFFFPTLPFSANVDATTGNFTATGSYRLEVTNTGTTIAKDVQLQVFFVSSTPVTYTANPTFGGAITIGGATPILWQYNNGYLSMNAILFGNGLGLNLNPGETKSMDVTLSVAGTATANPLPASVTYQAQIYVA